MRKRYAIILSGGSGTRFWPFSRKGSPKQFNPIFGKKSMFLQTVQRIVPLEPEQIIVITNALQAETARDQLASISIGLVDPAAESLQGKALVIVEPSGRNTAPAIALAAALITGKDPEGMMIVLPSDHYIPEGDEFRRVILAAEEVADKGFLVTLGIKPQRPETGYGYIKKGTEKIGEAFRIESFKEKPDKQTALGYLESGDYLWNAGMFIWRADVIWKEIEEHMPELAGAMEPLKDYNGSWELEEIYRDLPAQSIDYGVMERSSRVAVIPAGFVWSDVGSWATLWELEDKDEQGNTRAGNVITLEAENNLVKATKEVVALIGVRDLILVETEDAILLCHRDKCQSVRKVLEILKERGEDHLT